MRTYMSLFCCFFLLSVFIGCDKSRTQDQDKVSLFGDEKESKKTSRYVVKRLSDIPIERSTCGYRQRMITKEDFDQACFTFLSVSEAERHYHAKTTEFYYVLSGKGSLELDGDRVDLEPGTLVMIPPGIRHKADGNVEALIVGLPSLDPADLLKD